MTRVRARAGARRGVLHRRRLTQAAPDPLENTIMSEDPTPPAPPRHRLAGFLKDLQILIAAARGYWRAGHTEEDFARLQALYAVAQASALSHGYTVPPLNRDHWYIDQVRAGLPSYRRTLQTGDYESRLRWLREVKAIFREIRQEVAESGSDGEPERRRARGGKKKRGGEATSNPGAQARRGD
jgi:hypothetical protein